MGLWLISIRGDGVGREVGQLRMPDISRSKRRLQGCGRRDYVCLPETSRSISQIAAELAPIAGSSSASVGL